MVDAGPDGGPTPDRSTHGEASQLAGRRRPHCLEGGRIHDLAGIAQAEDRRPDQTIGRFDQSQSHAAALQGGHDTVTQASLLGEHPTTNDERTDDVVGLDIDDGLGQTTCGAFDDADTDLVSVVEEGHRGQGRQRQW